MTSDIFEKVLHHFHENVRSSVEKKVLLIFDNHESHISIPALNFCKENGIVLSILPPHTSNKLQPLDIGVFKSLKHFYDQSCSCWMRSHPGIILH